MIDVHPTVNPEAMLRRGLELLPIRIPEQALTKLLGYVVLLSKWGRVYNLTSITDPERVISHHILDSLAILPHLPPGDLADVGCGAGLPGIPIAIVQPDRRIALNDSNQKKIAFVRQVQIELSLPRVETYVGRVETWKPRELFDIVISRAFTRTAEFIALTRHLLNPHGRFMLMKGEYPMREISVLPEGYDCDVRRLQVPLLAAERHIVICGART